ncbi:hypothetical protein BG004_002548 [Podila humilis]|nr:hypothetical protein BG004_002548 [Podila humilis]
MDRLEELADRTRTMFRWAFTQHHTVKDVTVIDSAYGDITTTYVELKDKVTTTTDDSSSNATKKDGAWKEMSDGCASCWTQDLCHLSPERTQSTAYAAGRYGHVMFPECSHEPAVKLSETMLDTVGQGWASRVIFHSRQAQQSR